MTNFSMYLQTFVVTLLLQLLFVFKLIVTDDIKPICDGVLIGRQYYEKQMLFGTLNTPTNLVMHKYSGEIFFSHTVRDGNKTDFAISVCNVENRSCKDLKEVVGGVAIAYDTVNDDVYFGGSHGIYKYHHNTQSAHLYTAQGRKILHILIHRYLYYIESDTKKLYIYKHGKFSTIPQFENVEMNNFFISRHLSVYFSNKTALYKSDRINKPFHLVDSSVDVNQIVQHHKATRVYFAASDGIYYIHDTGTTQVTIKKAASITPVLGMTFRNTTNSRFEPIQVIYSDKHSIFKLTPSKQNEECLKEKMRISKYLREKGVKARSKKVKKIDRRKAIDKPSAISSRTNQNISSVIV